MSGWLRPWLDDWPVYAAGAVTGVIFWLAIWRGLMLIATLTAAVDIALLAYTIRQDGKS